VGGRVRMACLASLASGVGLQASRRHRHRRPPESRSTRPCHPNQRGSDTQDPAMRRQRRQRQPPHPRPHNTHNERTQIKGGRSQNRDKGTIHRVRVCEHASMCVRAYVSNNSIPHAHTHTTTHTPTHTHKEGGRKTAPSPSPLHVHHTFFPVTTTPPPPPPPMLEGRGGMFSSIQ